MIYLLTGKRCSWVRAPNYVRTSSCMTFQPWRNYFGWGPFITVFSSWDGLNRVVQVGWGKVGRSWR